MKKLPICAIIFIGGLLLNPLLRAEESTGDPAGASPTKRKVVYKKSESHSFGGLALKGDLKKPDLDYIYKRKGLRQEKIVNIPEDFNDEIAQGAGQF